MSSNTIIKLEKLVNAELTSKIQKSKIEYEELLIETNVQELLNVIQFF